LDRHRQRAEPDDVRVHVGSGGHGEDRRLTLLFAAGATKDKETDITRLRQALVGLLAIAIAIGSVVLTGLFLTGGVGRTGVMTHAEFANCGQGLRIGGDVKLRGVLVGRIEDIRRLDDGSCRVSALVEPNSIRQIPANVGAQIRAKTIFGEKWVEFIYPDDPDDARIAANDVIPQDRTIDPLEVETILNTALPLLDAIDPEHLSGALEALASGFVGHEEAAIRGIEKGIEALRPINENEELLEEGIDQLAASSDVLDEVDADLIAALRNLDDVNEFTTVNRELIETNLIKGPRLLNELSLLFETRFIDFAKIVNQGATVVGVLASRSDDLDALLNALPEFNSRWIRNLNHVCRYRQHTDEPGKAVGDRVPGRCWRVHNLISHSEGPYGPGEGPRPRSVGPNVRSELFGADLKEIASQTSSVVAP
ncbi:MAG: MCE family protein, partial [Actinomycetota bacterium]